MQPGKTMAPVDLMSLVGEWFAPEKAYIFSRRQRLQTKPRHHKQLSEANVNAVSHHIAAVLVVNSRHGSPLPPG